MSTSTVSASVDSTTKAIANARIREAGATPNSVIRDLWAHIASTGDIPVYILCMIFKLQKKQEKNIASRRHAFSKGKYPCQQAVFPINS